MFGKWGTMMFRWRVAVLVIAIAFVAVGAAWGTSVFGKLQAGGFDAPTSENVLAKEMIEREIGRTGSDVVILVSNPDLTVEDPRFQQAVEKAVTGVPTADIAQVTTFYNTGSPAFVSTDRHSTFASITLTEHKFGLKDGIADAIHDRASPGFEVQVGGGAAVESEINGQVTKDIAKAEALSMPVLFVLLVIIFGSLAAASLPLAIGVLAILGAFTALNVLTYFTDVSIFAVNVVTLLGLGLAIDYGLFIVSRFREELAKGVTVEQAISRTVATAGRTVAVSAVIVAVSLAGLLFFPLPVLESMGYGGIAAVLIAAIGALTVLPALLGVLGHKVDALKIGRKKPKHQRDNGFWYRFAHAVMRRPLAWAVPILALLMVLGAPFLNITFGGVDERVLPEAAESRQVTEALRGDFTTTDNQPIIASLTLDDPVTSPEGQAAIARFTEAADAIPGAGALPGPAQGNTAVVNVSYPGPALGDEANEVLMRVRDLKVDDVSEVLVGGRSAEMEDRLQVLGERLPWMGLLVVAATFILLYLAFGSVVLPIKAILMNVVSLSASFGAITWIFQDGHLSEWLAFTPTGYLEATSPILVLAIVFGLSMDYEVFLLSRVKEQYDITRDNTAAVALGLQKTGRIITSAALLLLVVIAGFSTSSISFIKLIGIAMLVAIIVDATIVRAILVPATMRMLGDLNWWSPAWLTRWRDKAMPGFSLEGDDLDGDKLEGDGRQLTRV